LDTYDGYEYTIQRADVIRYFVLYHYGGIYLDLDIGCNKPIDPLLVYPVILPKTIPVGVSNDLIFSEKGHPFMEQTIHNLVTFDHNWILNYPTVMFSTGPMFLSFQYGLWTSAHPNMEDDLSGEVRILPKSLYGKNAKPGEAPHSFFSHWYGSSWHADDAAFITFLGKWGKGLMWIGLVILVIGLLRLALSGPKQRKYNLRRTGGYDVVLPHWTHRHDGRRHIDFGWLSIPSSAASTTMPSPELTSPVDEDHVSLLPVPFEDINELSPASSEFSVDVHNQSRAGLASGTQVVYDAMRRARDRAYGLLSNSSSHPSDSHRHSSSRSRQHRRSRSRGVLFFLPAYLRRSDDVELGSTHHSTRPAVSRTTSSGSISSAPPQYDEEDAERAALLEREQHADSSTASARSHSPHPLRKKPVPAPLVGLDSHNHDRYGGGSA
jgi:inositol phosphorylceramide mannosyltransferase catalytic subunit